MSILDTKSFQKEADIDSRLLLRTVCRALSFLHCRALCGWTHMTHTEAIPWEHVEINPNCVDFITFL